MVCCAVQKLGEKGAIMDKENVRGETALIVACTSAKPLTVDQLVACGASCDYENNQSRTGTIR